MKTYSVHNIYIACFIIFLFVITDTTIKSILDPTYLIPGMRYMPRAVIWYFCIYLWYKFLLTAYKIEIEDNTEIKTYSLFKKARINKNEIKSIEDGTLSVDIIYTKGKASVYTLIDGIGNIKNILLSFAPAEKKKIIKELTVTKILIIILLIAFTIYIELDHLSRLTN